MLIPDGDTAFVRVDERRPVHALEPGVVAAAVNLVFDQGVARPRPGIARQPWGVPGGVTDTDHLTRAYARFNNPGGDDCAILITDDWRDGGGEDGGRGRAWRIQSGNSPLEISLNGHDVWEGECRLLQAFNAMILLRHGNERHYFSASAVDDTSDYIQLNATPNWVNGDLVEYNALAEFSSAILGDGAPIPGAFYYVKNIGSNRVELYTDGALTNKLDFGTGSTGRFYLERRATNPGYFGNGAPNLILQPTDTLTVWENGFRAVASNVAVTSTTAASDVLTAPNHRFIPGDKVSGTLSTTGAVTDQYVYPINDHQLALYATQDAALLGSGTRFDVLADSETGSLTKTTAAALAMPPLREAIFFKGRLIGINEKDNILISDPMDFLHYTLFTGEVPANLGESGQANWLLPLGEDALLIGKDLAVLVLHNFTGTISEWKLDDVTREFGGIAPRAAFQVGTDGWFLSRKGLASVVRTVAGEKLGQARTVSEDIPVTLGKVDWIHAKQAAAAVFNNRMYLALPSKGQSGTIHNDTVLSYNFLNQTLAVQQEVIKDPLMIEDQLIGRIVETGVARNAWEGSWNGELLKPVTFAVLTVYGEERLTFALANGTVCWFADGWTDPGPTQIQTSLTPRAYFGGARVIALAGEIDWDTFQPVLTVTARTAGWAEEETLFDELAYSNDDSWLVQGASGNDFTQPHKSDYAMNPDAGLFSFGVPFDVHQNSTETFRCRLRDRNPQLVIANTQGSCRVNRVVIRAIPKRPRASRQT